MNTQYLHALPQDWEATARVFSALGDATRQKILLLFEPGESISLKSLTGLLPLSRTAVAHHVTTLVRAGLLQPVRRGREVYYSLDLERAIEALDKVRNYAADLLATTGGQKP